MMQFSSADRAVCPTETALDAEQYVLPKPQAVPGVEARRQALGSRKKAKRLVTI
jgi:hypothetical protein